MEVNLLAKAARGNFSWIVLDRVFRSLLAFVTGVLVARHLGPNDFGMLSLSLAYAGAFSAFATFGLEAIVIGRLAHRNLKQGRILGTSLIIRSFGSILAVLFSCALAAAIQEDGFVVLLTAISSAVFVAQVGLVFEWLAQAQHRNWISALSKTVAATVSTIIKLVLILADADLVFFALATLCEAIVASLLMIAIFKIQLPRLACRFDLDLAKRMVRDALPLLLSGIAFYLYTQMDVIMLGAMADEVQVGNYTAATRISEAISFLPLAIVMVEFPTWAKLKFEKDQRYDAKISGDFVRIVGVSIFFSLLLSFSGGLVGRIVYGEGYAIVGELLPITAWISACSVWGFASSRLIILESQSRQIIYRNLAGIFVNFIGNFLLIPRFGAFGSAYATIASYMTANVLFYASSKNLRPLFRLLISSIWSCLWPRNWRIIL